MKSLVLPLSAVPVYEQMFPIIPKVVFPDMVKARMVAIILSSVNSEREIKKKWTRNVDRSKIGIRALFGKVASISNKMTIFY